MGEAREGHRDGIKYNFWGFSDSISLLLDSAVACWQMLPLTTTHSPHENKYAGMLAATRCVETQHYRRQIRDLVLSSTILHAWNEFNDNALKEKQHLAKGPVIQTETQAPSTQSDIDISAYSINVFQNGAALLFWNFSGIGRSNSLFRPATY